MSISQHYLNNKVINPRNWRDLEVVVDWQQREDFAISFSQLELVNEDAQIILDHINAGNIFEGLPYRLDIGTQTFAGYADMSNDLEVLNDCEVVVGLNKEQGKDWLNDVADGFTFRYLHSLGLFQSSDIVAVPYVINSVPDKAELLILALSTYSITKELRESIREIVKLGSEISDAATPIVTIGVTGPTAGPNIGAIVRASVKAAARIAYTIAMLITLTKLIKDIIEQILPARRYHYGLKIKSMFERACGHLNLSLNSTLLDSLPGYVLLPRQDEKGSLFASDVKNPTPKSGSPADTFGDLIRICKDAFNADYRIKDGVFYFERRDYWQGRSGYIIPSVFGSPDRKFSPYRFNTDELVSNYVISFIYDTQDQNTLEATQGRTFQAITELQAVSNPNFVKLQGLKEVALPLSLGTRKTDLTLVEKTLKTFLKLADLLVSAFGGTKPSSVITGRIGMLSLSSDTTTAPKLLNVLGGKLSTQPTAQGLWDNYHYIESFATLNGANNQSVIYEGVRVPFCLQNFVSLIDNNFVKTEDGRNAEIIRLSWNVEGDFAIIDYKVEQIYTNKLSIKTL